MLMRKLPTLLLLFAIASFVSAQPKSPVEPKSPVLDDKSEKGKGAQEKTQSGREYPAMVEYADGSKIRGMIVLADEKISSSCFCGSKSCEVREKVDNVATIEFTDWKKDTSGRRFRHSRTMLQLRDGSKLYCGRIPAFDRFALKREGKVLWCYTLCYRSESDKPEAAKARAKKQHSVKLHHHESSQMKIEPHPNAVRKIEFLREEGKSFFDLLPLLMK